MTTRLRFVRPRLEILEDRSVPSVFTVTNANDSGPGSLRQAILGANANSGADVINFFPSIIKVPITPLHTIHLVTALPDITDTLTVDGLFDSRNNRPAIELDGSATGTDSRGLRIAADNCIVNDLTINGFGNVGVEVLGSNNKVQGCFIGTTADGEGATSNQPRGVRVSEGSNNLIGGSTDRLRNVISGNKILGIVLQLSGTAGNTVQGNIIGLGADGISSLGSIQKTGVQMINRGANNLVTGNTISGNVNFGVQIIDDKSTGNVIRGNKIGVAADGVTARPNGREGILITSDSINNVIGGTGAGDGNIIGFNTLNGILVGRDLSLGFGDDAGAGNQILGNRTFGSPNLIDLGPDDGFTPNDPLDTDIGPNNLQNFPVLASAVLSNGGTLLTGALDSTPNASFRIEFFTLGTLVNGIPQDLSFLSAATATADASGHVPIGIQFTALPEGTFIVATATNTTTGDTSEFSGGVQVDTAPMIIHDALTPRINEGAAATLSGQLVDPDRGDVLGLRVNWGDNSPVQTFHPGLAPFAVTHRYLDDGVFTVDFTWFDNHGGFNSRSRQVTVLNVPPVLADVELQTLSPHLGVVSLSGRVVDPGVLDTFRLTVAWGDGTSERFNLGRSHSFLFFHAYRRSGSFNVALTISDDDGGTSNQSLSVFVPPGSQLGASL
jgi:hypothetical protein